MMKRRILLLGISILLLLISCPNDTESGKNEDEDEGVREQVDPVALNFVRDMGVGMNIGNTFDSLNTTGAPAGETGWGNPLVTKAFIQSLKGHGYKNIRLPVSWVDYMGPAPNYTIGETWMARVEEVVNWILDEDMYCVINLHHDGGGEFNEQGNINAKYWIKQISVPGKEDEINTRFAKVWEQIATRFKDAPDTLVFEAMNEIGFDNIWNRYSGGQAEEKNEAYRLVNKLNQTFVDTVRATGGNNEDRYLLIAGYWTDIQCTIDPAFKMPADTVKNRQIVSVHFYDPWVFVGGSGTTWGAPWDYSSLNNRINTLKAPFIDKGIPIILGEYSVCIRNDGSNSGTRKDSGSREKWLLAVTQKCVDLGICPVLWDTGLRTNNGGMGDIERSSPFNISANLKYVFDNLEFQE